MTTSRSRSAPRAFTLLEVVIVLGIFVVMFVALVSFFVSYNTSYLFERAVVSTSSSADAVMSEVKAATLPADQVLTSHTFTSTTYTSGTSTLVVEVPSIDSTGAVISGTYDYIAFYTDGPRVYEVVQANAASSRRSRTRMLTDTLNSLTFSYNNASFTQVSQVTVEVQTQESFATNSTQSHLRQQLYLRNIASS